MYNLSVCQFTEIIESQHPLRETTVQHNGSVKIVDESNNEIPIDGESASTKPTIPTVTVEKPTEETITTKDEKNETVTSDPQLKEMPFLGASTVDLSGGEVEFKLLKYPFGESCFTQLTWIITWPIYLVFKFTIPDCEKNRFKKWYPLTFIMCIVWIGSLSYLVAWFITVVGENLF